MPTSLRSEAAALLVAASLMAASLVAASLVAASPRTGFDGADALAHAQSRLRSNPRCGESGKTQTSPAGSGVHPQGASAPRSPEALKETGRAGHAGLCHLPRRRSTSRAAACLSVLSGDSRRRVCVRAHHLSGVTHEQLPPCVYPLGLSQHSSWCICQLFKIGSKTNQPPGTVTRGKT